MNAGRRSGPPFHHKQIHSDQAESDAFDTLGSLHSKLWSNRARFAIAVVGSDTVSGCAA